MAKGKSLSGRKKGGRDIQTSGYNPKTGGKVSRRTGGGR